MIIKQAKFLKSSTTVEQCPGQNIPEFAFIGRSNVGKSSLINMLTNNHKLAKTSGTPGKTQTINHFYINEQWYLVDLPGYGFAKVSKKDRTQFGEFIQNYILNRKQLTLLFVLVDCRHEPQKIDVEFINWLGSEGIPFAIIMTKTDKLKPGALDRNIDTYKDRLLQDWDELPDIFYTSSETKEGKEMVLDYIEGIIYKVRK